LARSGCKRGKNLALAAVRRNFFASNPLNPFVAEAGG